MSKTMVCVCIMLCCISGVSSRPQKEFSHEKTFVRAKQLYSAGKYDSTIVVIREYLKQHGREQSTEYIVPLLMEALIRGNDISYFKKLLSIYRRKFPKSVFLPRLYYLDGIVKTREQDYRKALSAFSAAINSGLAPELDSLAILNIKRICKQALSVNELNKLLHTRTLDPRVTEIVAYYVIAKLYLSGQVAKAKKLSEDFRERYPRSPYNSRVKKILSRSKILQKKNIQIGLLAPISGDNADIGKFVVQGVRLAVDNYNKQYKPPIDLVILDTRGNMVETARKVRELIDEHEVPVIIGPVLSTNAAVAASALMNSRDVVMITPTATDDGIARLGENIFQMNVTLGILGKRIARYAVENLNIREFGIIAPLTEYGRILATNFKKEVDRCGGNVIVEEHFEEGTNDFRIQFESLRSKLAERKWEQMALEGRPEYGRDARDRRAKDAYLKDSTIQVGGLFIPAESEDAIKIASQVYFYRIRSQLLGSNGWHTNATIIGGKRYVENAIFSTNFETDMTNERWKTFSKQFWDRFRENPDRVAAPLGFDAAYLTLQALKDGSDAKSVISLLHAVKGYHGVSGIISFDNEEGVNSEAAILKISDKKFIRVQ